MRVVDLEVTDRYRIRSHGNGIAYEITSGNRRAFIQGDDAQAFHEAYVTMSFDHLDRETVWFHKSWNDCLSHLCDELLEVFNEPSS